MLEFSRPLRLSLAALALAGLTACSSLSPEPAPQPEPEPQATAAPEPDRWDRHYNKLFELYGARWLGEERRSSLLFGLRETRSTAAIKWSNWGGWLEFARTRGAVDPD